MAKMKFFVLHIEKFLSCINQLNSTSDDRMSDNGIFRQMSNCDNAAITSKNRTLTFVIHRKIIWTADF